MTTLKNVYRLNQDYVCENLVGKSYTNESYFEDNQNYNLPGKSLHFIIYIDSFSFELFKNTGVIYNVPNDLNPLDYLFHDLEQFLLEEDKLTYINAIENTLKKHLTFFQKKLKFQYRSSFIFRTQKEDKRITTYVQNNIPLEIKDGKIASFFSTVTDISHTDVQQKHQLTFYNLYEKEEFHFELRKNIPAENKEFHLSKRELEILQCVIKGFTTKETAEKLKISMETVNKHRKNMIKKNNKKNIIHLATDAFKKGLL